MMMPIMNHRDGHHSHWQAPGRDHHDDVVLVVTVTTRSLIIRVNIVTVFPMMNQTLKQRPRVGASAS
jgi:hypothetical protein